MKTIPVVLIFILFVAFIVTSRAGNDNAADSKLFPQVKGWNKPSKMDTYNPNNLWDKIDGAADGYLSYNFEELTLGDYTGKEGKYITLEIYRHLTPEDAFGIYSQERPQEGKFQIIGAQGYELEGALNFVSDRYYVKIRSNFNDEDTKDAMREIAKNSAGLISPASMLPELLRLFPAKSKVANTEQYINSNFLGYSFLSRAFTSTYNLNGTNFNLFIIKNTDPAQCHETLAKYLAQVKSDQPAEEGKRYMLNDKYNGKVGMEWKGNYLFGSYTFNEIEVPMGFFDALEEKLK